MAFTGIFQNQVQSIDLCPFRALERFSALGSLKTNLPHYKALKRLFLSNFSVKIGPGILSTLWITAIYRITKPLQNRYAHSYAHFSKFDRS